MRILALVIIALFTLTACSKRMKQKIGLATAGPNEYLVERQQPLEVPPHFDLPEPDSF
jgi:hypothetical protein